MTDLQDAILKLRNENRDTEEKLREALNTAQARSDQIKQMKEEIKMATVKVKNRITQSGF